MSASRLPIIRHLSAQIETSHAGWRRPQPQEKAREHRCAQSDGGSRGADAPGRSLEVWRAWRKWEFRRTTRGSMGCCSTSRFLIFATALGHLNGGEETDLIGPPPGSTRALRPERGLLGSRPDPPRLTAAALRAPGELRGDDARGCWAGAQTTRAQGARSLRRCSLKEPVGAGVGRGRTSRRMEPQQPPYGVLPRERR